VYIAALLARTEDGWQASDTELDDVETLSDLVELAREGSVDDDTVIVYIEQEDAWFGVVRTDDLEDPRIYVSDAAAAARSSYGEILTDELLGGNGDDAVADLDALDLDGTEDGETTDRTGEESAGASRDHLTDDPAADAADATGAPVAATAGPLGDREILADLGLDEKQLLGLDSDALSEITDALGAAEILEAVR
jgi:putative tRNA adenosine deaminase-associated protein